MKCFPLKKDDDACPGKILAANMGDMLSKAVEWGLLGTSPLKKGKRLIL